MFSWFFWLSAYVHQIHTKGQILYEVTIKIMYSPGFLVAPLKSPRLPSWIWHALIFLGCLMAPYSKEKRKVKMTCFEITRRASSCQPVYELENVTSISHHRYQTQLGSLCSLGHSKQPIYRLIIYNKILQNISWNCRCMKINIKHLDPLSLPQTTVLMV